MRTVVGVGVIFTVLGLFFVFFAIALTVSMRRFSARALTTTGQVMDLQPVTKSDFAGSGNSGTTYRPVVNFVDHTGQPREFTSSVGSNPPRHRPGDMVRVLYDPDLPNSAAIAGPGRVVGPVLMGGLGLLATIIGVVVLVLALR